MASPRVAWVNVSEDDIDSPAKAMATNFKTHTARALAAVGVNVTVKVPGGNSATSNGAKSSPNHGSEAEELSSRQRADIDARRRHFEAAFKLRPAAAQGSGSASHAAARPASNPTPTSAPVYVANPYAPHAVSDPALLHGTGSRISPATDNTVRVGASTSFVSEDSCAGSEAGGAGEEVGVSVDGTESTEKHGETQRHEMIETGQRIEWATTLKTCLAPSLSIISIITSMDVGITIIIITSMHVGAVADPALGVGECACVFSRRCML